MRLRIETILWDLGGVLVEVDKSRAKHLWNQMTGKDPASFDQAFLESGVKDAIDCGAMSPKEALRVINKVGGTSLTFEQMAMVWNSIVSPKNYTASLLGSIADGITQAVLSNTDPLHGASMRSWDVIKKHISSTTYSCEARSMKPDPRIYLLALEAVGSPPERVLFVDDRIENVEAATSMGINGVHFICLDPLISHLKHLRLFREPLVS